MVPALVKMLLATAAFSFSIVFEPAVTSMLPPARLVSAPLSMVSPPLRSSVPELRSSRGRWSG